MSVGLLLKIAADEVPTSATLSAATRPAAEAKHSAIDAKISTTTSAPVAAAAPVIGRRVSAVDRLNAHLPIIYFSTADKPWFELSNAWDKHPFEFNNQSYKSCDQCWATQQRLPKAEENKDSIMEAVVYAKFSQHRDLTDILLSTHGSRLVWQSPDRYWGNGGDGNGQNTLGHVLEHVRRELRELNKTVLDLIVNASGLD